MAVAPDVSKSEREFETRDHFRPIFNIKTIKVLKRFKPEALTLMQKGNIKIIAPALLNGETGAIIFLKLSSDFSIKRPDRALTS